MHRGLIGGGRPGMGKNNFFRYFQGETIDVVDGEKINKLAVIGNVYDPSFAEKVKEFITEINRVKNKILGIQ